jgi:hypothetical protein
VVDEDYWCSGIVSLLRVLLWAFSFFVLPKVLKDVNAIQNKGFYNYLETPHYVNHGLGQLQNFRVIPILVKSLGSASHQCCLRLVCAGIEVGMLVLILRPNVANHYRASRRGCCYNFSPVTDADYD